MPETTQFTGTGGENNQDTTLKANFVLQNRYKIMGVLGGGGMGTVYQARDLNFTDVRRLVAIKEMHTLATDGALRASMLKTFRREANILAALSHPAIVKIYDYFDLNDRAYLVMEYVNGSDLELLISKTKELPNEKIIEWAIDLCDVLDYLHNQKPDPIVFRDMKPSNVMIDSLGKVRLIDFGIAKTFVSGVKHTMIGTEGYSAPEQYKGDVTPQSDIYSLGATLHHILTRKDPRLEPPFSFHERPILDYNPNVHPGTGDDRRKGAQLQGRRPLSDLPRNERGARSTALPPTEYRSACSLQPVHHWQRIRCRCQRSRTAQPNFSTSRRAAGDDSAALDLQDRRRNSMQPDRYQRPGFRRLV